MHQIKWLISKTLASSFLAQVEDSANLMFFQERDQLVAGLFTAKNIWTDLVKNYAYLKSVLPNAGAFDAPPDLNVSYNHPSLGMI